MNTFSHTKFTRRKPFLLVLCLFLLSFCCACKKKVDYFDYVSELRSNLFLAKTEEFSLKIYSVFKESPYGADGVAQPVAPRLEAYLLAPSGDQTVRLSFSIDGKEYGGEMSYDNVKGEYFYGYSLDASKLSSIECTILYGEDRYTLNALSVLTDATLSPKKTLTMLIAECKQPFDELTDEYGFAGEIYLRLIYEDSPYYYVGLIDREGKIQAFLLSAETGKILARRQ